MKLGLINSLSFTVMATGNIQEFRAVDFEGKQAIANSKVVGIAMCDAKADDALTVCALGLVDMVAGGTINAGDDVSSDADGLPVSGGTAPFGTAINAASPGERVSVLIR